MTDVPSVPGFYWARLNENKHRYPVEVWKSPTSGILLVSVLGAGVPFRLNDFRDWSGPIREQDAECSEVVCAACHWSGETSQLCLESIPCPDCGKNGLRVTM